MTGMLPTMSYGSTDCQGGCCKPFGPSQKELCLQGKKQVVFSFSSLPSVTFKWCKGAAEVWRKSSSLTLGCYLLFADDTVLLAPTNRDHSCALEQSVLAECDVDQHLLGPRSWFVFC